MKSQLSFILASLIVYLFFTQVIAQKITTNFVTGSINHEFSVTNRAQQLRFGKKIAVPANSVEVILIPFISSNQVNQVKSTIMRLSATNKGSLEDYVYTIKGATISTTDSYGKYIFENVPKGKYVLFTNSIAVKDTSFQLIVGLGNTAQLKVPSLTIKN